jgi:hypothetical protein
MIMTEQNPPAPPESTDPPKSPARSGRKASPKVGDVVQTSPGRYALVVGSEKVKHQHEGRDGERTDTVTQEHPLVIDLGPARRHELDPHED